jgi:hypothetical protein
MRAEKRGYDFDRLLRGQLAVQAESLQLRDCIQAIAALGFDGSGSVFGESLERLKRASFEVGGRGAPELFYGIEYAATGARDFFVAGSSDTFFMLIGAARGEDEVRVRIHKTRKDNAAVEIEFSCAASKRVARNFAASSDGDDAAFADEERAVADDAEIAEGAAAPGRGATQSQ